MLAAPGIGTFQGWEPDLIQQEGGGNRSDLSPAVVQAPSPGVGGALERPEVATGLLINDPSPYSSLSHKHTDDSDSDSEQ